MKRWLVSLGIALPMLLAGPAHAVAVELTVQPLPRQSRTSDTASVMSRMVSTQTSRVSWQGDAALEAPEAFTSRVKKEPAYRCKTPLRGVLELVGKPYLFVFDATDALGGGYDRLYFDTNGNGDLTDDGVVRRIEKESHVNRRTAAGRRMLARPTASTTTTRPPAPALAD